MLQELLFYIVVLVVMYEGTSLYWWVTINDRYGHGDDWLFNWRVLLSARSYLNWLDLNNPAEEDEDIELES